MHITMFFKSAHDKERVAHGTSSCHVSDIHVRFELRCLRLFSHFSAAQCLLRHHQHSAGVRDEVYFVLLWRWPFFSLLCSIYHYYITY